MASFFFVDEQASGRNAQSVTRPTLVSLPLNGQSPSQDAGLPHPPYSPRRSQVCPPELFTRSGPRWQRWVRDFWSWLWDLDDTADALPVLTGLNKVKSEFCAAMWDIQSVRANQVRDAVEHARSLRELWHLRADVFRAISTHRGQAEATQRIESLNNHFPVRMSRPDAELRQGRTTTW